MKILSGSGLLLVFLAIVAATGWADARSYVKPELTTKSIDELERLASDGDVDAQYALGRIHFDGKRCLAKNYAEAFKWLSMAADQGHASAIHVTGWMYMYGQGVTPQPTEGLSR